MIRQIFVFVFVFCILINNVQTASVTKRDNEVFQLLRDAKEKMKHGIECLSPSKYYAGSCYTYLETSTAPSWERAYNNCLSLQTTKDARLLAIESIDEYEFIERDLIGLKSGSDSVSVYIGLHKTNNTWFWLNNIPLKESPVYRFWVDNNRDILAYDCGILWLARNTSVITPAPCVEQARRPYVCKHTIDRCYNNSGGCSKYGRCINLPLINSYKCQCRFLYSGERCEKWSNQGLQVIIGAMIVIIAFIISFIINMDRSDDSWSFQKSTFELNQRSSIRVQHDSTSKIVNSDFVNTSTPNEKRRWSISSSRLNVCKQRYSFPVKMTDLKICSHMKLKRLLLITLPLILTIIIGIIILNFKDYIKETSVSSTRLFQFCVLYENSYYLNLLTLPIALVIIIFIIVNQTRIEYTRMNREKFSIYIPIPFNPFSKINRFDTMILCGILSHEILEILEEIFLKTTQMKTLTMNGPLFDLIRQIGLIIIVGIRYYPVYTVIEMPNGNILYYALCAFYMWLDLILRIFEQVFCGHISPLIRTWERFQEFKNEFIAKYETSPSTAAAVTMFMPEYEDNRSEGFRGRFQRIRERFSFRKTTPMTATIASAIQPFSIYEAPSIPLHSLNWSSIYLNISAPIHRNDSQSIFDQFGIDSSTINILKYSPYYLCLTYICFRLTYLFIINICRLFICCGNEINSKEQSLKHIYHEPTFSSREILSIEYRYVHHLFQRTSNKTTPKSSCIKSLLHKIYQPNKYFHYSKQILNIYMIAFMLIYYLTFHILQTGFSIIEKIYNFFLMPLLILYDELDLPPGKAFHLKYEMILACLLTAIIYYGQLFLGMKNYQRHMLNAYKGIFIDIPSRSAFRNTRLMSKNIHYPGYCIAYLIFGYIIMGNILFFLIVTLRVVFKHLFLVEEIAKMIIPILVIYLSKWILQWFLSKVFFLQKHGRTMALKNLRIYFVFTYFNFFFDCFLGMVSCAFRVSKAWIAIFTFLPRLDHCIYGRTLEKMDSGFISYVSFIHMECFHTHPVLVYFCSIITEQINKRYQYLRTSKREIDLYTHHQRIIFRWWLAITLIRNMQLKQLRKHRIRHLQKLSSVENLNQFLGRKEFNHLTKSQERFDSTANIRNHTTTCTTLLLDVDEQDDRKPSF